MVILLNGSFGIGKTTVARLLQQQIKGSATCDPEVAGYVLRRLPGWIPLRGRGTDDYQNMPVWRTLTVATIRAIRLVRRTVIVPMTFTNQAYLSEIRAGVQRFDPQFRHFCLLAPLTVVQERLFGRGTNPSTKEGAWQFRRASECCAAHAQSEFGEHVSAANRSPEAIAEDIVTRIASS